MFRGPILGRMPPLLFFSHAKPCGRPLVGSMERQHDIGFGDTQRNQVIGNSTLSAIVLNPDLVVFDIDMDKTPIHSLPLVPSNSREQIMITNRIKKELSFEIPIRWFYLAIPLQDLLYTPTVVI
jgi:hypothetical protein